MADVLSTAWYHFQFSSHIFVPSLRPLLEVQRVPLVPCHPGEKEELNGEKSEKFSPLFTREAKFLHIQWTSTSAASATIETPKITTQCEA